MFSSRETSTRQFQHNRACRFEYDFAFLRFPIPSEPGPNPNPGHSSKIFQGFGASTTGPARSRGCGGDSTPYSLVAIQRRLRAASINNIAAGRRRRRERRRACEGSVRGNADGTRRDAKRRVIIVIIVKVVAPFVVSADFTEIRARGRNNKTTTAASTWECE